MSSDQSHVTMAQNVFRTVLMQLQQRDVYHLYMFNCVAKG